MQDRTLSLSACECLWVSSSDQGLGVGGTGLVQSTFFASHKECGIFWVARVDDDVKHKLAIVVKHKN